MVNTINEARTPGELAAWLRQWADGADASDSLDDNDARQLAEAVERVCAPGNAAAQREALENARSKFIHIKKCADEGEVSRKKLTILCEFVSQEIDAALASPARNCDVGTAEEQIRRFETFCNKSFDCGVPHGNCGACPLWTSGTIGHDCEIKWSQMPYAPAEKGGEA